MGCLLSLEYSVSNKLLLLWLLNLMKVRLLSYLFRKHHVYTTQDLTWNPKNLTFKFKIIISKDTKDILKKLKRGKAAGWDNILTSLIIDGASDLAGPLTKLINQCLEMAVFPTTEKFSKITPVYKTGLRTIMDNYRPILVLLVILKVLKQVVHKQLCDYLEANNMLSKRQFGFQHRSSKQQAVALSE